MPVIKLDRNDGNPWGLWKIEESEEQLAALDATWVMPADINHPKKRMEWYAGRALTQRLMQAIDLPYQGITKDKFGKPFPTHSTLHLSLSHSHPYVAAYLHQEKSVGIDLEQPKAKLLNIAHRVFSASEVQDAGVDLTKLCLYWCAKEAMLKVYGKKDLTFSKNLVVEAFSLHNSGKFIGRIIVNNTVTVVPLYYEVHPEFTIVLNKPEK